LAATSFRRVARDAAHQRDVATTKRDAARRAVDEMYTKVAEQWLAHEPWMTEVQRDILVRALRSYEEFAAEEEDDPELRLEVAVACLRVGEIQAKLGNKERAREAFNRGIGVLEGLAGEDAVEPARRQQLAQTYNSLGIVLRDMAEPQSAR